MARGHVAARGSGEAIPHHAAATTATVHKATSHVGIASYLPPLSITPLPLNIQLTGCDSLLPPPPLP